MKTVTEISKIVRENQEAQRDGYAGLTTHEIAAYNSHLMFGTCENFDNDEWRMITD